MRFDIHGHIAMLDKQTREKIAEAREHLFGRFHDLISELDVRVDHSAQTGATLCQVTVRTANRVQVLARHRDRDALNAVLTALERARLQFGRALRPLPRRRTHRLSAVTP
jgi:ribosome-associated translation inhibitor RaiA